MPDEPLLPELGRSLRALGDQREPCARESHEAVYGPLLSARLRAGLESKEKALAALKGTAIMPSIETAVSAAAARGVVPPARARALAAEASELMEPLRLAFKALDEAAISAREGDASWELWVNHLRAVFARADAACEAFARLITIRDATPGPSRWYSRRKA